MPDAIPALDARAIEQARARQARLTKPAGSLGRLEELSIRLAGMTGRVDPSLRDAVVFTLAADHGVVADMGVDADLPSDPGLRAVKIRRGTANIARGPAMTVDEASRAIEAGRGLVRAELPAGLDVALTGDMGIANTTSSAALICAFTGLSPAVVVGRGTGVDDEGLMRKRDAVGRALAINAGAIAAGPLEVLAAVGGLEIAGLV